MQIVCANDKLCVYQIMFVWNESLISTRHVQLNSEIWTITL